MVSGLAKAVMDTAGWRDRCGVDGALHPCGDLGAYRMEFARWDLGAFHGRFAICFERTAQCVLELCVFLPAPAGAGAVGMPSP